MKENAAYNEQFVGECLKKIRKAPDAEEGLNQLLRFLGARRSSAIAPNRLPRCIKPVGLGAMRVTLDRKSVV